MTLLRQARRGGIRIERDPAFWRAVAWHPAVRPCLLGMPPNEVGRQAIRTDVIPIAAEHGGFLIFRKDPLGFTVELHTLFTPEGWGREVHQAAWEALILIWRLGHQSLFTFEAANNPRSRPPLSFGFQACGPWRETPLGRLRQWTITQQSFAASPAANRRRNKCPSELSARLSAPA